jgi:CDP-diacylglycerol--inositol 3-phosphatidyltransferase
MYRPAWSPFENQGVHFFSFYAFSYFLDAFDGMAARALGQSSHLGYYLDMVIDRISSVLCLYTASECLKMNGMLNANVTPYAVTVFYFLMISVEVLAHSIVVYYAEVLSIHQKKMGHDYAIVRLYLDSKAMLFYGCANFELFLLGVIVNSPFVVMIGLPGFVFRALANLARLWACLTIDNGLKRA